MSEGFPREVKLCPVENWVAGPVKEIMCDDPGMLTGEGVFAHGKRFSVSCSKPKATHLLSLL